MKITDKYVFFYDGIYSQWYNSPMVIDGVEYNCCEQYMMHKKALTFSDYYIVIVIFNVIPMNYDFISEFAHCYSSH